MKMPLKLTPVCKDYLWGGKRLKDEYGKNSDCEKIAETWELSCHKDGESKIANGPFKGKSLNEYLQEAGREALGTHLKACAEFPVLIKLIDAEDNLSVQVHPDDAYAASVEGQQGKTEMWYIIDCAPGAELIYGFKQEITKQELEQRIADNTLLDVVQHVPVHPGDSFFIQAGTLHAIGKGILIAEIQQSSNVTYRVYDYGRKDAAGNTRQLHVQQALEVTNRFPAKVQQYEEWHNYQGWCEQSLSACKYFTVTLIKIQEQAHKQTNGTSFHSLLCLEGTGSIVWEKGEMQVKKGDSIWIPANFGAYELKANEHMKLIHTAI